MVSLYADGQTRIFSTDAPTIGDILHRTGIKLAPGDLVEPAAATPTPKGPLNINVYRARPILVVDGGRSYHVLSAYQSPRLLAQAAGLTVFPEDEYTDEAVTDFMQASDAIGEQVTIHRAKPYTVKVDGQTRSLRTQAKTIGEALKGANIALGSADTVAPAPSTPLVSADEVSVIRVSEAVATITRTVPRPVTVISDPTVLQGQSTVKTEGSDGQKTVTWRIHYKDGAETSREAIQVVSETAPVARVVVQGTKVFFAGSVEYWRPQVEAAAAQYGLDPNMMLRIMSCESHGNATSVNAGSGATGLFQFMPSTWRSNGGTDNNIFDGSIQIQIAARKMATDGTRAWQCQ